MQEEAPSRRLSRSQVNPKTALVAGLVLLGIVVGAMVFLRASMAWLLILISAYLAAALNHPVEWLERRMKRAIAITLVMAGWIALAAGVLFLLIPPLVDQVQSLVQDAPTYLGELQRSSFYQELQRRFHLGTRLQGLAGSATGAVQPVLTAVKDLIKIAVGVISIYFLVLFMLTSGGSLVRGWIQETSPGRRDWYARVTGRVYHAIGGYVLGLLIIMAINAALTSVFLGVIGVPFFLALGVLSGIGSLVPMVGAFVAGALITGVALATGGLWHGVLAIGYYLAYQLLENHVLSPVIYRRTIHINPLILLAGLLVFAELGGLLAAILSVPVIATGQIILQEVLRARREQLGLPPPEELPSPPIIHRQDAPPDANARDPH